ncbi:hypothetical protein GJAV_G00250690 [Gymnothorax javanicus]|nr:hypothetical protein GJAV_G00250690 [Gymnothorax javanicus]
MWCSRVSLRRLQRLVVALLNTSSPLISMQRAKSTLPRVYVSRKIPPEGLRILNESGQVQYELWDSDDPVLPQELLKKVKGVDGLVCVLTEKIDAEVLDAAQFQDCRCEIYVPYITIIN